MAPSALDDYRRYRDDDGPNWPQLNREVAPRPRKAAAAPAGADGGAAAGAHGHGAMHGGAE
ncbi:unnamed protein product [Burkholderia pseudomallei]|nr:unnamed protein product [Burkholderia pseudomallei]